VDTFTVPYHAHEFKISRIKSLPSDLTHLRDAKHDGNLNRRAIWNLGQLRKGGQSQRRSPAA